MRSLFLLFFFIAVGCTDSNKIPSRVLSSEKMKLIIFDLLRADELVNTHSGDSLYKRDNMAETNYEQVFKIYGVNKTQFYESYKYYQAHPNVNKILFDSLVEYANKKRTYGQQKKTKVK